MAALADAWFATSPVRTPGAIDRIGENMKRIVNLTLILLIYAIGTSSYAQSTSAASPTMTLTVPQVATISVSNFTMGTSTNPGSFGSTLEGAVTLNYTVRVPKGGSANAKITIQSATTTVRAGTPNSTPPGVTNKQHSWAASGKGVMTKSFCQSLSGTTAGSLVTFAAGTKVNSGTATANFRVADSPTYDADTYTLPLTFTISSQ